MRECFYDMVAFFPLSQGNRWCYAHTAMGSDSELTYVIEGCEHFNGLEVPRKYQEKNRDEYFCTQADPVYGIRDFKHHLGTAPMYLVYTPPAVMVPSKIKIGEVYTAASHLMRYNSNDSYLDQGSYYGTSYLEAIEDITVPAGTFLGCCKVIMTRVDVFSDLLVSVHMTEWLAKGVGTVKSSAKVTISSPEGGDPFQVESSDLLMSAVIDGSSI